MTSAIRSTFGVLPDGREVAAVTLTSATGVSVTVITWGATLQSVILPDRDGRPAEVALGYGDLAGYVSGNAYFGATVGRFANRIADGRFELDGKTYALPCNDGPNSLHGGTTGFDRQLWTVVAVEDAAVIMRLISPDGDQGYPGTLTVTARYALDGAGTLTIDYHATTDSPTVVSITNHAYWNLGGEGSGSAMGHVVTIAGEHFTPVEETLIPTGERRPVAGTAFDFREPRTVGECIGDRGDEQLRFGGGYDHNWVVGAASGAVVAVATMTDPASGRRFTLGSDQPGLQFYSGNFLDGTIVGKAGLPYRRRDALAFEPQRFPDTPNQPDFGSATLRPGESYRNRIVYTFSIAPGA